MVMPTGQTTSTYRRNHRIMMESLPALPTRIVVMSLLVLLMPRKSHSFVVVSTRHTQPLANLRASSSSWKLQALVPLQVDELKDLLSTGAPTASQYSTYWGRTSKEQYAKWNEAALVTVLGTLLCYCLSFVFGSFVATLLGVVCGTWVILGPEVQAYQRNWELLGGRPLVDPWIVDDIDDETQGLYGALFLGRVVDATVVESASSTVEYDLNGFQDYTMEYDQLEQMTGQPYLLRLRVADREDRTMQVHARLSEEYLDIQPNHPTVGIVLSKSQKFSTLAALTDFSIPNAECWVGDYPYIDRPELERLLADDDDIWEMLEQEGETQDFSSAGPKQRLTSRDYPMEEQKVPARRRRTR